MRTSVPKKLRFEVFKRDSFTCQYCGRKAPDVLLELDHIEPVAKGGQNDILNLVTACKDCNSGKSDNRLSEAAVLNKQLSQLQELQERQEQINMMFQWRKSLAELKEDVVCRLSDFWAEHCYGFRPNGSGVRSLTKLLRSYSVEEIITAMEIATAQYLVLQNGTATPDSALEAWQKLSGICRVRRAEQEDPNLKRLYYIRGIIRKRFHYCDEKTAIFLLRRASDLNASIYRLEEFAKTAKNWTEWRSGMENFIADKEATTRYEQ